MLAEPNVGGWGGSVLGDGASALIATTDGDTYNFPVEVVESRFPVLVERYALNVAAGGGAGRHRGGFGVVREYRIHGAREAAGYGSIGGFGRVPWALGGGGAGHARTSSSTPPATSTSGAAACRAWSWPTAPSSAPSPAPAAASAIRIEREPERVREDVLDGYVTVEEARAAYGVALDPVSLEPDEAETARLRAR